MFTPQQIEQISFGKATFGGYDMNDVDEFLEPLTEDYITLYKENALLKSKMRILVGKLEEYRRNEISMKDAMVNAQKTCDKMVAEAEAKCAEMLAAANTTAAQNASNADVLVAAETCRVEEARKTAASKIEELQEQMRACIHALDRIKTANQPAEASALSADDVADQISQNLEALMGSTLETQPKAAPRHPSNDTTTSRFANLQFGRNYDPSHE